MKFNALRSFAVAALLTAVCVAPVAPAAAARPQKIEFGETTTYAHSTGWFSIDMPRSWTVTDSSSGTEGIVRFSDATVAAYLKVNVRSLGRGENMSASDLLAEKLSAVLQNWYKGYENFEADEPRVLDATKVEIDFRFDAKAKTPVPMRGDAFIELHEGRMLSFVVLELPAAQYEQLKEAAYVSIDSLDVVAPSAEVEVIGELAEYEHPDGVFRMLYPSNWEVTDRTDGGWMNVLFENPDSEAFIMIEGYRNTGKSLTARELVAKVDQWTWNGIGRHQTDFLASKPASGPDFAHKTFTYVRKVDGMPTSFMGVMRMQEDGAWVTALRQIQPTAYADLNAAKLAQIIDSFEVDADATLE